MARLSHREARRKQGSTACGRGPQGALPSCRHGTVPDRRPQGGADPRYLLRHGFCLASGGLYPRGAGAGKLKPLPPQEGAERWPAIYLVYLDPDDAGPGAVRLGQIIQDEAHKREWRLHDDWWRARAVSWNPGALRRRRQSLQPSPASLEAWLSIDISHLFCRLRLQNTPLCIGARGFRGKPIDKRPLIKLHAFVQ